MDNIVVKRVISGILSPVIVGVPICYFLFENMGYYVWFLFFSIPFALFIGVPVAIVINRLLEKINLTKWSMFTLKLFIYPSVGFLLMIYIRIIAVREAVFGGNSLIFYLPAISIAFMFLIIETLLVELQFNNGSD
jgi:hypothetical protein